MKALIISLFFLVASQAMAKVEVFHMYETQQAPRGNCRMPLEMRMDVQGNQATVVLKDIVIGCDLMQVQQPARKYVLTLSRGGCHQKIWSNKNSTVVVIDHRFSTCDIGGPSSVELEEKGAYFFSDK